jgi:hypothetical protein
MVCCLAALYLGLATVNTLYRISRPKKGYKANADPLILKIRGGITHKIALSHGCGLTFIEEKFDHSGP